MWMQDPLDDFEDIPLDFRHHEAKKGPPKPKFPKEWRMTRQRRQELREEKAKLEAVIQQPLFQES